MSDRIETHVPCPDCGSSDALCVYEGGATHCFSCHVHTFPDEQQAPQGKRPFVTGTARALPKRGLYEDTCKRYGYVVGTDDRGDTYQIAPYYDSSSGRLVAQKLRDKDKNFKISGDAKKMGLFGSQLARRGGKMIVLTEGEIDALSCSQALGNTWPCLSMPNGTGDTKALIASLEFLETYEKVVLAFDNDEPGHKLTEQVLELLSPGKAYVANLGEANDPNELLNQTGGSKALRSAIWEAKEYRPDGVVNLQDLRERVMAPLEMGHMYPWAGLNDKTFGYRPGDLVTWTAGTGVGKTAVVSELVYDMIVNQDLRVGIIYLEEGVVRSGRRLMGIHMDKPIHLPGNDGTPQEMTDAFMATLGTGRLLAYDHFGSIDVDLLCNRIRFLAKGFECDVVVLDHVSMVVSGSDASDDERRLLDRVVTNLKTLCEETGLTIHLVSHLKRKEGRAHEEGGMVSLAHLRGTQAIAQLSDAVIALERNQQAKDEDAKHITRIRVLKNRYSGDTGACERLRYIPETGRLEAIGLDEVNWGDNPNGKQAF